MSKSQCKIDIEKAEFSVEDDLNYESNPSIISLKKHLSKLRNYKEPQTEQTESYDNQWYPYCNTYYPYTEDVDAFARVNHLLAQKPSILSLNLSEHDDLSLFGHYSEHDVHKRYLLSHPLNFVILGKPDIGQNELGKLLAQHWNCVYIDPEILIGQEIESGSRAGQCIEFNLRCGRAIGIDVILKLLEKRLKTQTVQHRGFVLCGLPVIPNDLYKEDPISSETAVFTVRDIFEELLDATVEIGVPPTKPHVSISSKVKIDDVEGEEDMGDERMGEGEEVASTVVLDDSPRTKPPSEPPDIGSASYNICEEPEISTDYEEQLNFIFNLIQEPYLIIYIMCPTADVITKRKESKFHIYTEEFYDILRDKVSRMIFKMYAADIPPEVLKNSQYQIGKDIIHLTVPPYNLPAHVQSQLDNYHFAAVSAIERRVLLHNPEHYLRLDGRVFPRKMFNIVKSRLEMLPFSKSLIPRRLTLNYNEDAQIGEGDEEEPFKQETNLEGISLEEAFTRLKKREAPMGPYKWSLSDWGTLCPVSVKEGSFTHGDANFAVQFMNKIFFLRDEEAFFKFYKNPRPYLVCPFPKSSCRIYIFGARCTGKTEVAKCMSYFLNGTVLNKNIMQHKYFLEQLDSYKEHVYQAALADGIKLLDEKRTALVLEQNENRLKHLQKWKDSVREELSGYIALLEQAEKEKEELELSPFPMQMETDIGNKYSEQMSTFKKSIAKLKIPTEESSKFYRDALNNEDSQMQYCPQNLKTEITAKPATVFDRFVVQYAQEILKRTNFEQLAPFEDDKKNMYVDSIREVEDLRVSQGSSKGGWVIDDMPADLEFLRDMEEDILPDDVFILNPSGYIPFEEFKLRNARVFTEFRKLFLELGNVDAAWRCPDRSTTSMKDIFAKDLIDYMVDNIEMAGEDGINEEPMVDLYEKYKQSVDDYKPRLHEIKEYFMSKNITPIEIDSTKSDMKTILVELMNDIEDVVKAKATQYTNEDRAEEVFYFGSEAVQDEMGEGAGPTDNTNAIEQNRRYGDTSFYCPVTYKEYNVLWRGKEDYAAKFEEKVYLLANEEYLEKFLTHPRSYSSFSKFVTTYPPLRICIIGIDWTLTNLCLSAIASNLALLPASYQNCLKSALNVQTDDSFRELRHNPNFSGNPIHAYIVNNQPIEDETMVKVLNQFWQNHPFTQCGFVIEDFPKRTPDVAIMTKYKYIPDAIINLTGDEYKYRLRIVDLITTTFKENQQKLEEEVAHNNNTTMETWTYLRGQRFEELMEEKVQQRYANKLDENEDTKSQVSYDSVAEQEDVNAINEVLDVEFPEPVMETIPDSYKDLIDNLENIGNEYFTEEWEHISVLRELCEAENVHWVDVNINFDKPANTKLAVLRETNKLTEKRQCIFERCYDLSLEQANDLVDCGYCFLSKFGKTCPVQYYIGENPVQMYHAEKRLDNLFAVLHRSYIYYICGKESLNLFKEAPLKYLNKDFNFPLITFKIAVMGPVDSGKTTLSERLAQQFCFKYITRGRALRHVLSFMPYTELAKNIESVLRKGWEVTDEMVIKAVEAVGIGTKSVCHGVIMDGFPNTINEMRHMWFNGLIPHLIVDLQADEEKVLSCPKSTVEPLYSSRLIKHMLREWNSVANCFRRWVDKEFQIRGKMSTLNKWTAFKSSLELIMACCSEVKHYYKHIKDDWPLRVSNMAVSHAEFLERQSNYKEYCPVCLSFNELCNGGFPPDRTGLVHYKHHFYWLCPDHIELFLKCPECYFSPYNEHSLPDDLPIRVNIHKKPDNLYCDGYCVVCPRNVEGSLQFAVSYRDLIYLFDSEECLQKFMRKPIDFAFIDKVKVKHDYPLLNYEDLPILGMLEQYVATQLTKAVCHINRLRPVVPGLSIEASAAICIGVFLKKENELDIDCIDNHTKGYEMFYTRVHKLEDNLKKMKSIINPYLYYEETIPPFEIPKTPVSVTRSISSVSTVVAGLLDEILNQIDYDKELTFM
ncbi:unnamed protein product [Brassicogethes aeneus]|uniref:Adenylate kinase 9-like n=1 Tax=Brassicogethes aeneus TaxID=1431903 RepID=A0A9P0FFK5_BRAAE|nr:unnamed protein product [Brassicogethes aeneus]